MNDSDYSLLLHNITSTIGSAKDNSLHEDVGSPASGKGRSGSRKRGAPSNIPFSTVGSSPPDESAPPKKVATLSSQNSTKLLRVEAELDELRLENEQGKDELAAVRDELERLREKSARQLSFLESENTQLKRAAAEKIERYYEEKKKWQARIRALETASSTATTATATAAATVIGAASTHSNSISAADDKWRRKLEELENSVAANAAEAKSQASANAELHHKVKQLEQELLIARIDSESSGAGDASEQRDLRKRLQDVEGSLRRKTRELERLERKDATHAPLLEENSALTAKVATMQAAVDAARAVESNYLLLAEEKRTWNAIFGDICRQAAASTTLASASATGGRAPTLISAADQNETNDESEVDATPVAALRLLSSAQQKCSLLLKCQGELEAAKANLKRQLARTEAALHEIERDKADAAFRADTVEDKLRLAQQQVRLFDGEVKSLRAMLKTFDAEASFGRPEAASAIKLKDEAVSVVQAELDACRQQAQSFAARVGDLEEKLALSVSEATELRRVGERARQELQGLQHATGLDFVPGRTRVLHMQHNPCTIAGVGTAQAAVSTVPMERLKVLQTENKQLTEVFAAAQAIAPSHNHNLSAENSVVVGAASAANAATHASLNINSSMLGGAGAGNAGPDSSKLNLRLKEMFRERITSFREAVYLLTGYKVDLLFANEAGGGTTHPRLRLRSMYAESPEDSLLFQWRGDSLELMQTSFAEKLDHRMLEHLRRCNSVPCFLSSITLELFESQTFQG